MLRDTLKRLIPATLLQAVRLTGQVEPGARVTLFRLAARRAVGGGGNNLPADLPASPAVLFICHGNILRSPLAEALYRKATAGTPLGGGAIASAGLHATDGREADRRGITLAPEFGVSLDSHRARALTGQLVGAADLIMVMDRANEAETISRHPASAGKVYLLGGGKVIPDPYSGGEAEVRAAYRAVELAVVALRDALVARQGRSS